MFFRRTPHYSEIDYLAYGKNSESKSIKPIHLFESLEATRDDTEIERLGTLPTYEIYFN